jgi:hypothetical protein
MESLKHVLGVLVPFGFFAAVVLSLYFYFKATSQIRLSLIEKGLYNAPKNKSSKKYASLKIGIFLIGISLGIFMGYLLGNITSINSVISFFTMILLFGGISLIVNQFIGTELIKSDE